ncbi:uncharacterized protein [Ptychodera flava]|uniref:uncharacterized protein n=1 Tax=Ptychodera flava TaxID=63121 RepID=UPI00396A7C41
MGDFSMHVKIVFLFTLLAVLQDVQSTLFMDDYCGSKITSVGDRLQSQKSDYYGNNVDCELTIEAPEGFDFFKLRFEWIDMESSPSGMPTCPDFVEVYDGYSSFYSNLLLRRCTEQISDVTSSGDALTLRLKTDPTSVRTGFALVFTAYHTGPCEDDGDDNDGRYYCSTSDVCIDASLTCDCDDNCPNGEDELCTTPCQPRVEETQESEGLSILAISCITVAAFLLLTSVVIVVVCVYRLKKDETKIQPNHVRICTTPNTTIIDTVTANTPDSSLIAPSPSASEPGYLSLETSERAAELRDEESFVPKRLSYLRPLRESGVSKC